MSPRILDFRVVETLGDLARHIGASEARLVGATSPDRRVLYLEHRIAKRGRHRAGEYRQVWEPFDNALRDAHASFARRFADFLGDIVPGFPHPAAFGYVRGRNTLQNAAMHCGHRILLRADVKDFFPSISANRLEGALLDAGLRVGGAALISRFATIDDRLPLGLNASPLLSNLVCLKLDRAMTELAARYGCAYSRYADDLAFSGESVPTRIEVASCLDAHGFVMSGRKFRITKRGQAHYVTGLSISEHVPHAPRAMRRELRQALHYSELYGVHDHLGHRGATSFQRGVNSLDGMVRYVTGIEAHQRADIRARWAAITGKQQLHVAHAPLQDRPQRRVFVVADETEFSVNGEAFMALGMAVTEEPNLIREAVESLVRDAVKDPFLPGRKSVLRRKGFHYAEAHPQLAAEFCRRSASFPFRGYIAFARATQPYAELWSRLFAALLTWRMQGSDRADMTFLVEENSRISPKDIASAVEGERARLELAGDRVPRTTTSTIVSKKDEPMLAVIDTLLGVFRGVVADKVDETAAIRFESLRDKYRLIVDVDSNLRYSRRRAFTRDGWVARSTRPQR